jgi:hypothetical protein
VIFDFPIWSFKALDSQVRRRHKPSDCFLIALLRSRLRGRDAKVIPVTKHKRPGGREPLVDRKHLFVVVLRRGRQKEAIRTSESLDGAVLTAEVLPE